MSLSPRTRQIRSRTEAEKIKLKESVVQNNRYKHILELIKASLEKNGVSLTPEASSSTVLMLTPSLYKFYRFSISKDKDVNKKQLEDMRDTFSRSPEIAKNSDVSEEILETIDSLLDSKVHTKELTEIRDMIFEFYVDNFIFGLEYNRETLYPEKTDPIDEDELLELTGMYAMGFTYSK
jgi:hypothetical protein